MCGIVGVQQNNHVIDSKVLCAMRDIFPYRGPDDKGEWIGHHGAVGLGHRRLSIIDTTADGHQPMTDSKNGNVIVFNGEVYNYIEIKSTLRKLGVTFESNSDTEVILKAYRIYGTDCLQYFNGMFSIAIWDNTKKLLFLARDRLGVKPLYYYLDDEKLVFASETKAIHVYLKKQLQIDDQLIDQYMSFGYIPGEDTLEKGVRRLLPGHYAIYQNNQISVHRYWNLIFNTTGDLGEAYYLEKGKELINSAINLRLRSDVPLGIFLSGGLDSSAVVGLLAQNNNERLKTFSVAYDFGKEYNEMEYARKVANKFNTDHHEIFVDPYSFKEFIPEYIRLMDEPVTESAAISLNYVSKLAAEHVTVVLSGEGSDEIFAGYDFYRYMLFIERLRKGFGVNAIDAISRNLLKIFRSDSKIGKYLTMAGRPLNTRYKGISSYEEYYKKLLYKDSLKQICEQSKISSVQQYLDELFMQNNGADPLSKMLNFDTKTWLVDDLLIKADRMSMASSLELRVPFLDYRLVEFAAAMPSKYKINNGEGKYLLKRMMEDILPKEIIYRKKMGFPTPLKKMFQSSLKEYVMDVLTSSDLSIQKYFKPEAIRCIVDEHLSESKDHHRVLWQLIVLEEWMSQRSERSTH
jgi:asparagine synthase (glutamine-hydrolysing)